MWKNRVCEVSEDGATRRVMCACAVIWVPYWAAQATVKPRPRDFYMKCSRPQCWQTPHFSMIALPLPAQLYLQYGPATARHLRQRVFASLAAEEQRVASARPYSTMLSISNLAAIAILE